MIVGCHTCGYFTNNKFSLRKHVNSKKHVSKLNQKWYNLGHKYLINKLLDRRINQLSFLRKNEKRKLVRCDISTQTDGDFWQKYQELKIDSYKSETDIYYDADTDVNDTNMKNSIKRKRQYSNRRKKGSINGILKKKTMTPFFNGWMMCVCLLVYICKKKDSSESLITKDNTNKIFCKETGISSVKKKYIPPLSFEKLWKEQLGKNKIKL